MLKRLEDKGFVRRSRIRSAAISTARRCPTPLAKKSALSEIVRVFFNGSPASAASALLGMSDKLEDDELERARADDRPRAQGQRGQVMHVLIEIALKSLLIAGLTLGLLAADEAPLRRRALVGRAYRPAGAGHHRASRRWCCRAGTSRPLPCSAQTPPPSARSGAARSLDGRAAHRRIAACSGGQQPSPRLDQRRPLQRPRLYAVPAAILLFITFLALARLIALRARADVLVDGHWLSALARAQRRMGFKHGTALLTSNELASPISWGLMRPVILLNTRAVEASGEAEAIIAHELAHVARMDWAKLLLARVATALFWFNPLVWLLAREAHQLREEAADDAVLAADIADTDYAQLLVGVARHECPGLLLGAHGVAPSKSSLARRVARVLDGTVGARPGRALVRARRACRRGADRGSACRADADARRTQAGQAAPPARSAKSQPASHHIIRGRPRSSRPTCRTSSRAASRHRVQAAVAAVAADEVSDQREARSEAAAEAMDAARDARENAIDQARDAAQEARDAIHEEMRGGGRFDQIIAMQAAGITPEYVERPPRCPAATSRGLMRRTSPG